MFLRIILENNFYRAFIFHMLIGLGGDITCSSSIYFEFRHDIYISVQIKQNLNNKTIAYYINNITFSYS